MSDNKKRISLWWRVGVALCLGLFLYVELSRKEQLSVLGDAFGQQLRHSEPALLVIVLFLSPFNWWLESQKWYPFVYRLEPISPGRAWAAVLVGVSFSVFTPNRVGEFGGRILYLRPEHRWKAALSNLMGNYSQLLVLLTFGSAGALWFLRRFGWIRPEYFVPLLGVAVLVVATLFFFYFRMGLAFRLLRRVRVLQYFKRFVKDIQTLEQFSAADVAHMLFWATLRYGVYSMQYWFLLHFFGIRVGIWDGFAGTATLFLLQTGIPLPPAMGLVTRGGLAIFVWGLLGANEISSVAASFFLWIINLVLPALAGTFLMFFIKK